MHVTKSVRFNSLAVFESVLQYKNAHGIRRKFLVHVSWACVIRFIATVYCCRSYLLALGVNIIYGTAQANSFVVECFPVTASEQTHN